MGRGKKDSDRYTIIIGDSTGMDELENRSVHLVITSPPYPMIEMWDDLFTKADRKIGEYLKSDNPNVINKAFDSMHLLLAGTFKECHRVLIDGGICCINIGDGLRTIGGSFRLFPNHSRIIATLENLEFNILPYILWKKPTNKPNAFLGSGFLPTNAYVTLDCEFIIIARKGGLRKFRPKDSNRYLSRYSKGERDVWFSQIWNNIPGVSQSTSDERNRNAAFPIEVPSRLIRMFSVKGDMILDPFLGTGTTLRAAHDLDRIFIGYEIERSAISWEGLKDIDGLQIIDRERGSREVCID